MMLRGVYWQGVTGSVEFVGGVGVSFWGQRALVRTIVIRQGVLLGALF